MLDVGVTSDAILALVRAGGIGPLREALQSGTDVDATSDRGLTGLMLAAKRGRAEIVDLLLEHGADATRVTSNGESALYFACTSGAPDAALAKLAAALISHGGRVDEQFGVLEESGLTLLHSAAYVLKPKVCRVLLEAGADVGAVSSLDATPLHKACEDEYGLRTATVLVGAGAPIGARNTKGQTPLDLALRVVEPNRVAAWRALLTP
jgi:ankyrin repeat protein